MAQFLRPDITITATSFTNGFAAIDESVASDADFAFGANNTAAVLEVGLSNPTGTPGSGTTTIRYRVAKTNAGVVNGSGNAVTVTCSVRQGANVIATDTARTATGTWTEYSFTPDMSAVTDWSDVRLHFTTSQSGGTTANRRGGAVSWAELEAPDAQVSQPGNATGSLIGVTVSGSGGAASGRSAASGLLIGVSVIAMGGSADGGATGVPGNASGALAGVTLAALAASAIGRASSTGLLSGVTVSAGAGTARGRASAGGTFAQVSVSPIAGAARSAGWARCNAAAMSWSLRSCAQATWSSVPPSEGNWS